VEKKGLSNIVGTVLLVLLGLAGITILWTTIGPTITDAGESIEEIREDILEDIDQTKDLESCTPQTEICDGLDNDCDDEIDEECINPPAFAIELANSTFIEYTVPSYSIGNVKYFKDTNINATITEVSQNNWKLTINNSGVQSINEVWFPWQPNEEIIGASGNDDIIYYPRWSGTAFKADSLSTSWEPSIIEGDYPGEHFAPIIIMADNTQGKIIAATNWPPKRTWLRYAKHKMGIFYKETITPDDEKSYNALIKIVQGDASSGQHPWQIATDVYGSWLQTNLINSDLTPEYSDWMKQTHGWQQITLSNIENFDITNIQTDWNKWKNQLNWLQLWGQQSDFGQNSERLEKSIHPRYNPDLNDFIKTITGHTSYYQRSIRFPGSPYEWLDDSSSGYLVSQGNVQACNLGDPGCETNLDFLKNWISTNVANGSADSAYISAGGAVYLGDPLFVANLFKDGNLPVNTVIEWPVDIYPTAYLMAGSIVGVDIDNEPNGFPGPAINPDGEFHKVRSPDNFGEPILVQYIQAEYYKFGSPVTQMPDFDNSGPPDRVINEKVISHGPFTGDWVTSEGDNLSGFTDDFGIRFRGKIRVPETGSYQLILGSDDGSKLFIDGVEVLDHGGIHTFSYINTWETLSMGWHDIEVQYFERDGPAQIQLRWDPPFGPNNVPNEAYLFHEETIGPKVIFPQFGRYLLGDRIFLSGTSNRDKNFWGYGFDQNYFTERQTFILGAKFDAGEIYDVGDQGHVDQPLDPTLMNPILNLSISERDRVGWWSREPIYLDKKGISNIGGK